MVDADTFREALGACTPVAVITSYADERPHGTTVSAFCSLSLDPPLVLVSLDRGSGLLAMVRRSGRYGVNVLEQSQQQLARQFARKGPEKFEALSWSLQRGLPRLDGAGLWLACAVRELVDGGDHIIAIGLVEAVAHDPHEPLLYRQQAFGRLAVDGPLAPT